MRQAGQREAILRYWKLHPHAADTVEGIVNWWLQLQRYRDIDIYKEAEQILEELAANGIVTKTILFPGKVIYSKCRDTEHDKKCWRDIPQ